MPAVGLSKPESIWSKVDLPLPEIPESAYELPRSKVTQIFVSTGVLLSRCSNVFETFCMLNEFMVYGFC